MEEANEGTDKIRTAKRIFFFEKKAMIPPQVIVNKLTMQASGFVARIELSTTSFGRVAAKSASNRFAQQRHSFHMTLISFT